ncbi:UDP-glucose dehydrogenase family protein [Naasia lichenicola]|uniref:UDP-glucose 6-dehydrogenase n=1 Tax=Naasia lichenicola TaxID=2565933 RepID=A0A4S4FRD4_9MICO|nr:UDP-glucose/GDP-mannose dehydrogenase family protein [Naasia lichenicola]THG30769.1 UDP-glucose/GDP-mannose dehydrogenase family protein [Naasia lichenicola]THG32006.1 UDP-glucose/GDP-mannose dehydrogenase family protein [Naasia lichenicola]
MKLSVIGCGYLGAVHAASMAELGHEVVGIDVDPAKISALSAGKAPFFEPGLDEILQSALASGRLSFSNDLADAKGAKVHFVAVGTPQRKGENAADMTYVNSAIDGLIPHLSAGDLVVGKSTVPVGTAARLAQSIADAGTGAMLAWNPEFLREGFAVKDTIAPDRLVYGVPAGNEGPKAKALLDEVYATALSNETPLVVADYATAELVKVSANAFLATKISFINAMAEIAEVAGADVTALADAIGYDARIGRRFLNAGIGFGGGCLPKDIRAFAARAEELGRGESVAFLKEIDAINLRRRQRAVDMVIESLGGQVFQKKVAVLGLAFKPDSDDVRDSPALDVAVQLHGLGAKVVATDPEAIPNSIRLHPQLGFATDTMDALHSADIVVLVTEWKEFRELDPVEIGELVKDKVIIDGRNTLDPEKWRAAGWTYRGMGRP